jgi:ATP-dependent protease HslVU (ClpYQ) peptidase subunit
VQEFSRFYAYGQGSDYAMGAMYALYDDPGRSAEDIVRLGLEAAAEFDHSTGLPITVIDIRAAR